MCVIEMILIIIIFKDTFINYIKNGIVAKFSNTILYCATLVSVLYSFVRCKPNFKLIFDQEISSILHRIILSKLFKTGNVKSFLDIAFRCRKLEFLFKCHLCHLWHMSILTIDGIHARAWYFIKAIQNLFWKRLICKKMPIVKFAFLLVYIRFQIHNFKILSRVYKINRKRN